VLQHRRHPELANVAARRLRVEAVAAAAAVVTQVHLRPHLEPKT